MPGIPDLMGRGRLGPVLLVGLALCASAACRRTVEVGACQTGADCEAGFLCRPQGCVKPCVTAAADCPSLAYACVSGQCEAIVDPECDADDACPGSRNLCVDGFCVADPAPSLCAAAEDCWPAGDQCLLGRCSCGQADRCPWPQFCLLETCQCPPGADGDVDSDGVPDCIDTDLCAGAADGTPCGDTVTDTICNAPDSCVDGFCVPNFARRGLFCQVASQQCLENDLCDGLGGCQPGAHRPDATPCGDSTATECSAADACLAGVCDAMDEPNGSPCADQGRACFVDDTCDGAGQCVDQGIASTCCEPLPLATTCDLACSIDLVAGTTDCGSVLSVGTFVANTAATFQLNMASYASLELDVAVCDASGWTFHLADSLSSDGFSGDAGDSHNDAELHLLDGTLSFYGNDFMTPPKLLVSEVDFVPTTGCTHFVVWAAHRELRALSPCATSSSEYGLQINPPTDPTGTPDANWYLGLNRVVATNTRNGTGVRTVDLCFRQ